MLVNIIKYSASNRCIRYYSSIINSNSNNNNNNNNNKIYYIKNNSNNNNSGNNDKLIKIGDNSSIFKRFTKQDVELFSKLSGDKNPIHLDEEYALNTRFKRPIVHGSLVSSLISTAVSQNYPGAIYIKQEFNYLNPTFINDTIKAQVTITNILGKKIYFQTKCIIVNQDKNQINSNNSNNNNNNNNNNNSSSSNNNNQDESIMVVEGPAIIYHPDLYSTKNNSNN